MNLRSMLGSLQLPIANLDLLVAVGAVQQFLTLSSPPAEGDGFVTGLAALVLYAIALVGVVVAALGFAIPPGDGFGIRFNPW